MTIAASADVSVQEVYAKLRDKELFEDWEGSDAVVTSTARRVRAELIADAAAKMKRQIEGNAEIDRRKRAAMRESAEAGRRQRESQYFGPRVSAPGAAPEPWMDAGDD